jgi:hypothetical protein
MGKRATYSKLENPVEGVRNRVRALVVALSISIILVVSMMSPVIKAAGSTTIIGVTPPIHIAATVGGTFSEAVIVSTTEGINSIDLTITYNSTLLEVFSVYQGTFFPASFPPTIFTYDDNPANGTIHISAELLDPQVQTGNGTLAEIRFNPILDPQTLVYSPIRIDHLEVLNSGHQPISCDTLGSMYFWKFITPPIPPTSGRLADIYTQRGGTGEGTWGGEFTAGSLVILSVLATYNDFPVQHLPVAFQVQDDQNQTVAILVGMTDENGVATTEFRIRNDTRTEGKWTAVATVDISCTIVLDYTYFTVFFPHVIGGYTVNVSNGLDPTPIYVTILAAMATTAICCRRRRRKEK